MGVHIGPGASKFQNVGLMIDVMPARNWIGSLLLRRALEAALEHERILLASATILGELNNCVFQAAVSDAGRAAEILKRELQNVSLLEWAKIGVSAGPDGWQCVHPSTDIPINWIMDTEHQAAFLAEIRGSEAALRSAIQQYNKVFGRDTPSQG